MTGTGVRNLLGKLLRFYYLVKLLPFLAERRRTLRASTGQGLVAVQIDGLSHAALMEAIRRGYAPHMAKWLERGDFALKEYRCGLPSSTPYAQAGIFFGQNDNIPAFRWYEKAERRVVSCNHPAAAQLIRSRIANAPGLLAGGSSYANLFDGGAEKRIFTVSSPGQQGLFDHLGRLHLPLLVLAHPVRVVRAFVAFLVEVLLELGDRYLFKGGGPETQSEGFFPLIRALCTVVMGEIQTMGVLVDIYIGCESIYSTYNGYDELAHHFGPLSRPALKHLKYVDARLAEIRRMIEYLPGRRYRLLALSDHGQTPAVPFATVQGCTLGALVSRAASSIRLRSVGGTMNQSISPGRQLADLLDRISRRPGRVLARVMRRTARSIRKRMGIDLFLPENYFVDEKNELVVTYSSDLAHLYFAGYKERLTAERVRSEFSALLDTLLKCSSIGPMFMVSESGDIVVVSAAGECRISEGRASWVGGADPLAAYCDGEYDMRVVERLVKFPNSGDIVLFGAMVGGRAACFDDQVGAHGSIGGPQDRPFILAPSDIPVPDVKDAAELNPFLRQLLGHPPDGNSAENRD